MGMTVTVWDSIIKGMQVSPAGSAASHSRTISYQPHTCLLHLEMSPSVTAGLAGQTVGVTAATPAVCSCTLWAPALVSLRPLEAAGSSSLDGDGSRDAASFYLPVTFTQVLHFHM